MNSKHLPLPIFKKTYFKDILKIVLLHITLILDPAPSQVVSPKANCRAWSEIKITTAMILAILCLSHCTLCSTLKLKITWQQVILHVFIEPCIAFKMSNLSADLKKSLGTVFIHNSSFEFTVSRGLR
jgi:hypothetical protein